MNNLLVKEKVKNIFPKDIQELCLEHFNNLMAEPTCPLPPVTKILLISGDASKSFT